MHVTVEEEVRFEPSLKPQLIGASQKTITTKQTKLQQKQDCLVP